MLMNSVELAIDIAKSFSNKIVVEFKPHPMEYSINNELDYSLKN